jgi:hypothetical protein
LLRELQKFLKFANFYRRFIKNFSTITRPFYNLLKKGQSWKWQDSHEKNFRALQKAFSTAPVLATYDYNRKTVLETDALDWASEKVLSQFDDKKTLKPVAYFSAKHFAAECNYEIYDKKLLAIIKCLKEWRPEFQGINEIFGILINYKNLKYFTITKLLN